MWIVVFVECMYSALCPVVDKAGFHVNGSRGRLKFCV